MGSTRKTISQFTHPPGIAWNTVFYWIASGMLILAGNSYAAENAPEQAAAQPPTELSPKSGRVEWLESEQKKFLVIYTEAATRTPLGGVIIVPGLGAHPDWPGVVASLRRDLPDYGWTTLSIQPPEAPDQLDYTTSLDAMIDETQRRIQAGVKYLHDRGITPIALIGHGLGAAMAAAYLATDKAPGISALVGIGMHKPSKAKTERYNPEILQQIMLPVLDIYGSLDIAEVKAFAKARAIAAKKRGASKQVTPPPETSTAALKDSGYNYRQVEIVGADHVFTGYEHLLVRRTGGWLKRYAAGTPVTQVADAAK